MFLKWSSQACWEKPGTTFVVLSAQTDFEKSQGLDLKAFSWERTLLAWEDCLAALTALWRDLTPFKKVDGFEWKSLRALFFSLASLFVSLMIPPAHWWSGFQLYASPTHRDGLGGSAWKRAAKASLASEVEDHPDAGSFGEGVQRIASWLSYCKN